MPAGDELFAGAKRLHAYLLNRHYHGGVLCGPDAGVRFNLRVWRFLKSGRLWWSTGDGRYLEHVDGLADFVKSVQLATGELPYVVEGDYSFLRDSRSYPQCKAVTLFLLLYGAGAGDGFANA